MTTSPRTYTTLRDSIDARIELDTDTPAGLQNSLLRATRDVVVGASLQPLPGLDYIELATEVHHLYCGSDHPWYPRLDSDLGPNARSEAERLVLPFALLCGL